MIDSLASFWECDSEKIPFAMEKKKKAPPAAYDGGIECNCVPVEINQL